METPAPAGEAVKKIILTVAAFLLLAAPASAQMGYYSADGAESPPEAAPADDEDAAADQTQSDTGTAADLIPQTTSVTSLQKCLDKLSPEDAAEVRLNPIRPYQECLARLSNAAAEKRSLKVTREKENKEPVAENARNFSRVTEEDGDSKSEDAAKEAEAESGHWSATPAAKPKAEREPIEPEGEPGGLPEESAGDEDSDAKPARKEGFSRFIPEIKPDKSKASFNK